MLGGSGMIDKNGYEFEFAEKETGFEKIRVME